MINYVEEHRQFNLMTTKTQLSINILPTNQLVLSYFGEKIGDVALGYVTKEIKRASYLANADNIPEFKLEQYPLLYPAYGNPDLRNPAFQLSHLDGSRISDFRYVSHNIQKGKPALPGLPATFATNQVETLELILRDEVKGLEQVLSISCFEKKDVFTQSVRLINQGQDPIKIEKVMSLNLDFLTDRFDLLTLSGAWGREMGLERRPLHQGFQGIDSKRGASGHGQNPFLALADPETTEDAGAVYGMNLVYSGNFIGSVDVDMHQNCRMQLGINPFEFDWELAPEASFTTPEAVFLFTAQGFNDMSQRLHHFYTECLITPSFAKRERPILINNWEATYFDFDQPILLNLAKEAADLGVELFVLDDGWFGNRQREDSSLGDWFPNQQKLGGPLPELIQAINDLGLAFGLWVEPEMVSPKSHLFTEHPDWIVQVPKRTPQQVRNQYVLDLSRTEVQTYLIDCLDRLLTENNIAYIKWDMNRNITDSGTKNLPPNRQKEFGHRYILGLYHVLETITKRHPTVLFESCAGGGGRFDPGMLYYTPQIWTSDDTDAIERLKIQKGTSLIYPPAAMSGHVSASPNHQVGRQTSLITRGIVAKQGNFGYELNLLDCTTVEKEIIKDQISQYKKYRSVYQFGEQTRLTVFDEANEMAWMKVLGDQVIVSYLAVLAKPNTVPKRLKLKGLAPQATYQLLESEASYRGAELMNIGLDLPRPSADFYGKEWILVKKD